MAPGASASSRRAWPCAAARMAADNGPGWPLGRPRTGGRQLVGRMPHHAAGQEGRRCRPAAGCRSGRGGQEGRYASAGGRMPSQRRGAGYCGQVRRFWRGSFCGRWS